MLHFLIENLPGELAGLLQHHAAVFGVGIVAEISALVDEALPGRVDQDAERIRVLLKLIADRKIAEFRRIHLPLHGMTAGPVAARTCADGERHANAVAGVEARAADLGEIPSRPEIARAPFRIGFEAAAGEHHRLGAQFLRRAIAAHPHAFDAVAVIKQIERARPVANFDAALLRGGGEHGDKARPAADRLHRQPAPELESAARP